MGSSFGIEWPDPVSRPNQQLRREQDPILRDQPADEFSFVSGDLVEGFAIVEVLCFVFGSGSALGNVSVTLSPNTASLQTGQPAQFSATVVGTSNTAVTWTASSGTVTSTGQYTAPSTAGTYTVTATSVQIQAKRPLRGSRYRRRIRSRFP